MPEDYKTSKRIKYATDNWGNEDQTYLEIEWMGKTLQVEISDERISIFGPTMVVDVRAVNALEITPRKF